MTVVTWQSHDLDTSPAYARLSTSSPAARRSSSATMLRIAAAARANEGAASPDAPEVSP